MQDAKMLVSLESGIALPDRENREVFSRFTRENYACVEFRFMLQWIILVQNPTTRKEISA